MKTNIKKLLAVTSVSVALAASLAACGSTSATEQETSALPIEVETTSAAAEVVTEFTSGSGAIDTTDLFTERDLLQTADLSSAKTFTVTDGETITIQDEGVYLITGTASNATIQVEAADDAKVQLVLDSLTITNDTAPCIYIKSADKVFVTTTDSTSSLSVSGAFTADGTTNINAAIFSKDDLVLNGVGTLEISSSDNAVSSKDDLKITGGTYKITCSGTAFDANDSIAVADGSFEISESNDGFHAENDDDDSVGYVYIGGGSFLINAIDDAIHATTIVQIDNGTFELNAAEGIEGTYLQFNGGTISINASDDGINASVKSSAFPVLAEFNGGDITVVMGQGDTDAIDSNGDLTINGGTLNLTAQSPFDYDGAAVKNGGTIIVNGTETDSISNQMMGGGMGGPGGMGGGPGGMGGDPHGGMPGGGF